jgi:threonine/homoserine/homoserine lactone efflux protein
LLNSLIVLIGATTLLLGSPGPAPLALAASSAIFGTTKTIPFLLGILSGLGLVIVGSAMGLSLLIEGKPVVKTALQIIGVLYILCIALKIASAPVHSFETNTKTQPSFIDGLILNLSNPKAYAAIFALFTQFALPYQSNLKSLVTTGLVCLVVAIVIDTAWVLVGSALRRLFAHPVYARPLRLLFAFLMLSAVALTFMSVA